jgi:hypothetical protein
VEMRIPDAAWHADEDATELSPMAQLQTEVEALTRKVGRLERRQQRFADMIRLLLALHDQTAARLAALDGGLPADELSDLEPLPTATARVTEPEAVSRPRRARRTPVRGHDA